MKLSIIIVNYNVRYFLEQCLHSVQNACKSLDAEVFVVDNSSVDGSVKMVREKFPEVILIENKENLGFSSANNQAMRIANGEYFLLLNPDTLVEDDTLRKVVTFMDEHPDAGGLGVKMIDGKGKFLPESKRALPTPVVSFYKIFGLSSLFPRSRIFSQYHLGYLDKDKVHEIDVLAGAFMLLRKRVLDEIGLLDESFFMYGEDIDLSYRITQAGYKNYYYPGTRIIHYKGESTKKSSINYVFMFYNAMIIFARKHFSKENARSFSMMIHSAIYLRAFFSVLTRFAIRIFLPLLDGMMIFAGMFFITFYWEKNFIFPYGGHYPPEFMLIAVPIYILIWLISVYIGGGYDRPIMLRKVFQGMLAGTLLILLLYSLLSENYRFSRALILFGASWGLMVMLAIRALLHFSKITGFQLNTIKNKKFVIIGEKEESERVADLLQKTGMNPAFVGLVSFRPNKGNLNGFIGDLEQIKDIIIIHKIDEVIFCAKDIPAQVIIDKMSELKDAQVDYKIAPPESLSIIGSNSINTSGDLYVVDINAITKKSNLRSKRVFDLTAGLIILILYPLFIFLVRKPISLARNLALVFFARKSWVGYTPVSGSHVQHVPMIKKGVLNPMDALKSKEISEEDKNRLNILYARDYHLANDINILFKGFRNLGRS
ncbi:MAG: glycosyltransferase [Bacteroidetes bacterium]|nr:glycosyltransferase [Bacteroidota bacterium]